MSPRVQRAAELVVMVKAILADSDLEHAADVHVTDNPADIERVGKLHRGVVVVLPAPRIEYPVPGVARTAWSILLVARGPILTGWARLDDILAVLEQHMHFETAEPGGYKTVDSQIEHPGYTLTYHDDNTL